MEVLDKIALDDPHLVFFAAGLAIGAALMAAWRSEHAHSGPRSLSGRIENLELRFAAMKDRGAILRTAQNIEAALPRLVVRHLATAIAIERPSLWLKERPDTQQIAREFAESLRSNSMAGAEVARSISENVDLRDPSERMRVARAVKDIAQKLDTSFWDRHSALILTSAFSPTLKAKFRLFYTQVRSLKNTANELPREPTLADLDSTLDQAIDLITTSLEIIDELEKVRPQS